MMAGADLLCELMREYHRRGWVSGTGGGICRVVAPERLLVAPSGVHKERLAPEDFFVISTGDGRVLAVADDPGLVPSECTPVFRLIVRLRHAGSVLHSHALSAVLAGDTAIDGAVTISGLEMLKGIQGVAASDRHAVPVVQNTVREAELVDEVGLALGDDRYGSAYAVLVRDHGAYIWGRDVWEAKRHAEVYHYLFDALRERRS